MYRPRHPQSQGMMERSNGVFKTTLLNMCTDGNTLNWPMVCPFAQGAINTGTKRGHSRAPYELVFGTVRNAGFENNTLSPAILAAVLTEDGLDAIDASSKDVSEDVIVKNITSAQALPQSHGDMTSDEDEDGNFVGRKK